ncbi:hypothetical protein [Prevotella sp. ne3005]|nr:hypothetical protein [Prevotella sp. ne3005]
MKKEYKGISVNAVKVNLGSPIADSYEGSYAEQCSQEWQESHRYDRDDD